LAQSDPAEPIFAALSVERGDPYSDEVRTRKLIPVEVGPAAPPAVVRSMPAELAAQLRADLGDTAQEVITAAEQAHPAITQEAAETAAAITAAIDEAVN
jgi:hypothetical protein